MPTKSQNPYEPSASVEFDLTRTQGNGPAVASFVVVLIGVVVFGAGAYGTWMTIKNIVSRTATNLWPNMIAVSTLYLLFGFSFFASTFCIFKRRNKWGLFFFLAPIAVFGTLLSIFGF